MGVKEGPRVVRELILVAQHRPNLFPILADARFPQYYRALVEDVDVVYVDIAQPDETDIAIYNAEFFLKDKGYLMMAIKARSIDVTKGRFRAPLQIVISLLIWTYSMEELLNIFDHITKK